MGNDIIADADSNRLTVIAGGPEVDAGEDSGILNLTFALERICLREAVCFQWALRGGLHYILS